jgi:radical SAM protein with 4Fe4S-binding SPASM domain
MKYGFLEERHRDFPAIVHVENTNICNIRCIHCPQADPYRIVPGYKPQTMSMEVFERVVQEVAQYPAALRMTPDGETLLPKEFKDMVAMILERKLHLFSFNTNGLLLEGGVLESLLSGGETRIAIEVSLDALYRESYDRIRRGSNYERVMKNLFTLLYERSRRGLEDKVKVMVSIINQPELEGGEHDRFIRFWEPLVDKVIRRTYLDVRKMMPEKEIPSVADGETRKHHVGGKGQERWPCVVPFTRLVVTYDGHVRFCPDDWEKTTTLGSVQETSLAEIWTGKAMVDLRNSHLDLRFAHPTCLACREWKAVRWGYDYTAALNDLFGENVL